VTGNGRILVAVGGALALVAVVWGIKAFGSKPAPAAPVAATTTTPTETAHITATLFYASSDGQSLVGVKRDVPLASGVVEQGRQILLTELQAAPQPYVKVIPEGTVLRAFYVTDRGDAFVDLSPEVSRAHPGGSLNELMTVYALVNAVTTNLPAVQRVQILVDGKEVDALAGHVDIRRPLTRDVSLVRERDSSEDAKLKTQRK
jgi:spore germination protein GerM